MSRRLPTGKVPSDVLRRIVFPCLGVSSDRVLQGPDVGEDAAVIDMGDKVIVAKANPITGAEAKIGWLSVHINANDVASCGAKPQWFLSIILLPEGADESLLETIMADMHDACREVGVSIIGGHTETTLGLSKPIVAGFMMGEVSKGRYVTTGGARPGDQIILTKGAGIEGTGILATDLAGLLKGKVSEETLTCAEGMLNRISVVKEALKAVEAGGVHSLHTPTEGGLIQGLWEMAEAAGVGLVIREESVLVAEETRAICDVLDVDPLKLLSSGALLIVSDPGSAERLTQAIEDLGVKASVIGEVKHSRDGRQIVRADGSRASIEAVLQDEIYRMLDEHRS
ncbi:MAG: AIR synthase family protein [Candidatus Bathyarchaeota archaeon]|nr:MAG: AIR synthase family protein [Candidatus Bathyarchaeota archaeon]